MKINKIFSLLFVCCLVLSGCQKDIEETDDEILVAPLKAGDYGYSLPYADSTTSVIHNKYSGNKKDVYNMGEQALELAKPYFNPKTTYVSEGLVLDSSELERFDTSYRGLGLLKFKTEYNPEGLNPEKGNFIESGTGIDMYNAILVSDVHEIDFKDKNGEYVGFQFIIVLNENVSYLAAQTNEDGTVMTDETGKVVLEENRRTAKISTDQLYNYGSIEAGQRLVNYLRNNHPEVGNLPIQVLLYKTTSSDSMLNGTFIGQSYVTNRASTTYEVIKQEWVFAPSSRLNDLDSVLAGQIQSVKSKLFENWPNEVGFYGKVFFEDNMASAIELEINMRGKTYVEIQSLIQYLVQLMPTINNDSAKLNVHVLSDGQTIAIIQRDVDSEKVELIVL